MLQLQLYCYWCMHKAHLWVNTLCMDFLREYFCTIMVILIVFEKGVVFFLMQLGMDDMIGV